MHVAWIRSARIALIGVAGVVVGCGNGMTGAPPGSAQAPKTIPEAIRPMVDRSHAQISQVKLASGHVVRKAALGEGFQHVLIQRKNADGTSSIACVDQVEQAEEFLKPAPSPAAEGK